MHRPASLLCVLIACVVPAFAQDKKDEAKKDEKRLNEALRQEILGLRDDDQALRKKVSDWLAVNGADGVKDPKKSAELMTIQREVSGLDKHRNWD